MLVEQMQVTAEFRMIDALFHIRPAHMVDETDQVAAFMDQYRQPSDPGHVLVIPRAHVENIYGDNNHHIVESCYKGLARALKEALAIDPRQAQIVPSTKGTLAKSA